MVGSSMSIADSNTVLNTIVADALCEMADELEKAENFENDVTELISSTVRSHKKVIFDGNGYAHVRSALMGSSVCITLKDGLLNLGTWQQIILMDFDNKPRSRCITVQIIS